MYPTTSELESLIEQSVETGETQHLIVSEPKQHSPWLNRYATYDNLRIISGAANHILRSKCWFYFEGEAMVVCGKTEVGDEFAISLEAK
jgi:hypothetical protein